MNRPSFDEMFLNVAKVIATRGTCVRRQVGAVAIDKNNYILGTGYNGSAKNTPHCIDTPCKGANSESGTNLDSCDGTHAEQNLVAHVRNPLEIHTVYLTVSPCVSCVKLLIATGCKRIAFSKLYPNSQRSRELALESKVEFDLLYP